jgi:pimeloyl-ACP methyl ester carboxylesterase
MLLALSIFIMAIGLSQPAGAESDTFTVELPCTDSNWGWYGQDCEPETIEIPNGLPIYALLVSGYHQNKNLDKFHYYNFAKYLQERGAYVHYAWWNNLLAPYMERPLHNDGSVPSHDAVPTHDAVGFVYEWPLGCIDGCHPNKALPAEDYQFQQDANSLLTAIRQYNPDAAIILVGHSMGGDAVVRLADNMPDDFVIDLLAPIDPVGNRTCLPTLEGGAISTLTATCNGLLNFKRYYAVREDWFTFPDKRQLGANIKYLYHRWQNEFAPPFDYMFNEHFTIDEDSCSVQLPVGTNDESGYDVPVVLGNFGGGLDGHGEIVGFRGALLGDAFDTFAEWLAYLLADLTRMFSFESYPLALEAEGDWPKWLPGEPDGGPYAQDRIDHLKMWEKDPHYLYKKGFEPWNPGLCMVSKDMCNILDSIIGPPDTQVNQPPVADAGADQTVPVGPDCSVAVTLDGSGSYDEDGDNITYSWV